MGLLDDAKNLADKAVDTIGGDKIEAGGDATTLEGNSSAHAAGVAASGCLRGVCRGSVGCGRSGHAFGLSATRFNTSCHRWKAHAG